MQKLQPVGEIIAVLFLKILSWFFEEVEDLILKIFEVLVEEYVQMRVQLHVLSKLLFCFGLI